MKDAARLLCVVLLIPITLATAYVFGHEVAAVPVAIAFIVGYLKYANVKERRFMIALIVLATIGERANVALGAYGYSNTAATPIWMTIAWGVLGLSTLKFVKRLKGLKPNAVYAAALAMHTALWLAFNGPLNELIYVPFAVLLVYLLPKASSYPPGFFLLIQVFAVVIEAAGVLTGMWFYYGPDGSIVMPAFSSLASSYTAIITLSLWASGADR